jgi:hypothetical protein
MNESVKLFYLSLFKSGTKKSMYEKTFWKNSPLIICCYGSMPHSISTNLCNGQASGSGNRKTCGTQPGTYMD